MKFDKPALRTTLLAWHRRHGQHAPWRESGDPYHALVAAVMAQQTQMSRVLPKYGEFIATFPTVEALAAASTGDVLRAWAPLGYNMRALRLHKAAQRIASMPEWPRTASELQQIDGIGPFTSAVISSFAFGEPVAAIDVNVVRVLSRLSGSFGPLAVKEIEPVAGELCSRRAPGRWNQAMMDLGALVCIARQPKCGVCPIAKWCRAREILADPSPWLPPLNGEGERDRPLRHVAERQAEYRTKPSFVGSTRYYRGRIVHMLRELSDGESLTARQLFARIPNRNGLDAAGLRKLLAALERDGLVRIERGRTRLP